MLNTNDIQDPRDKFIKQVVCGKDFAEIGGLWGVVNEKISVAAQSGASSLTMIDTIPMQDELWMKFHDRMSEISAHVFCLSQNFLEIDTKFDVVHCSGVVYHCPDFCGSIRHLSKITQKYLILTSVVTSAKLDNERGLLNVEDYLYVPDLNQQDREILAAHWRKCSTTEAIGITTPSSFQKNDFASFWWLPTVPYFRKVVQDAGFSILDQSSLWWGNAHTLLLTIGIHDNAR